MLEAVFVELPDIRLHHTEVVVLILARLIRGIVFLIFSSLRVVR